MADWTNIATTPIPWVDLVVLPGTYRYRVHGFCADGTQEFYNAGVWVTR